MLNGGPDRTRPVDPRRRGSLTQGLGVASEQAGERRDPAAHPPTCPHAGCPLLHRSSVRRRLPQTVRACRHALGGRALPFGHPLPDQRSRPTYGLTGQGENGGGKKAGGPKGGPNGSRNCGGGQRKLTGVGGTRDVSGVLGAASRRGPGRASGGAAVYGVARCAICNGTGADPKAARCSAPADTEAVWFGLMAADTVAADAPNPKMISPAPTTRKALFACMS